MCTEEKNTTSCRLNTILFSDDILAVHAGTIVGRTSGSHHRQCCHLTELSRVFNYRTEREMERKQLLRCRINFTEASVHCFKSVDIVPSQYYNDNTIIDAPVCDCGHLRGGNSSGEGRCPMFRPSNVFYTD